MSLMDVLAQVATEMAASKGASGTMRNPQQRQNNGGLFGSAPAPSQSGGGLQDLLGGLLGGQAPSGGGGGANSGLGGLLEALAGGQGQAQQGGLDQVISQADNSGGLGGILEQLTGGAGGAKGGGGLGDLLGQLTKSAAPAPTDNRESFGNMLNQAFAKGRTQQPTPAQEVTAGLMLKAMIQAAKSDGQIDDGERDKLLEKLGDVSKAEREFVSREMAAPVDVAGLARQVPRGLENQVYAMSVLGIDLDQAAEANYLHAFATEMSIDQNTVNHIHDQFGVPRLYR